MPVVPHGRFRRRLTIAFIATAGLSAAAIGVASYLLVRDTRLDDFHERSRTDAEVNHDTLLDEANPLGEARSRRLVRRFQRRSVDVVVIVSGRDVYSSHPEVDLEMLEDRLDPAPRTYTEADLEIPSGHFLAIVTPESGDARAYFLYSKEGLDAGLSTLSGILWRSWLAVVVVAGLIGHALARRTLKPVSSASVAARSLAEGLLDTRLPVEREDEFGAWASSFNQMADALERKINELTEANERERRFTSDVSHELRTPISALVTSASMLEAKLDELDPDARWIAERTITQVRRVRGLVEELLEISRLQAGSETVEHADVNLALIVSTIVANHGWREEVTVESEPVIVATDKARVERIVVNLLANALEHGRESVRVSVRRDGLEGLVEVQDRGPGIPPEHLEHIFERFYKAEPSRRGGSGLGLAIAAENARLLGGSISVDSRPADTSFVFRLPLNGAEPARIDPRNPIR